MKKVLLLLMCFCFSVNAQSINLSQTLGPIKVADCQNNSSLDLRWLTWGGDASWFVANGGAQTVNNSYYYNNGLKITLSKGDDFLKATKDYMEGKTPFLRGTLDQIGLVSEVLNSDPRTEPVVVLQLTWSAGDHIISRENIKTLNDLNNKKIRVACQQWSPHVGLIYKVLQVAKLDVKNIEFVWTKNLTGPDSPADLFRKDSTIDLATVITPDMLSLTAGTVGTGAENTVKGAHVLVSTKEMSRAIADVLVVRSDFYAKNKSVVEKIVAGYLYGTELVVKMRKSFEETKKLSEQYKFLLNMIRDQFGNDVIADIEIDGHGLLLDAVFVGLPGQISFFKDSGNLSNFEKSSQQSIDLSFAWSYSTKKTKILPCDLDYKSIAKLAGINYVEPVIEKRIVAETTDLFPDSNLDNNTIYTFTINFDPEQNTFSAEKYGNEFNEVIKNASVFGNAAILVRGHSDPTKTLVDFLKVGISRGLIKRSGNTGNYVYYMNGKELNLSSTKEIIELVKNGNFDDVNPSPRETMQVALNLSFSRANSVKNAIIELAKIQKVNLDESQIQPIGVGIVEPLIPRPKNLEDAKKNMRVEFRVVRVSAEVVKQSEFDY